MKFKATVVSACHWLAHWSSLSVRRAKTLDVGRVLAFHGVGNWFNPAEEFEAHLRYLKRNFEIIPLEAFMRRLDRIGGTLRNTIVLTFDDGLRNNFTVAYPILQRLNLPATFFVCPGLIESQRWLWNQEARARLHTLGEAEWQKLASQWKVAASGDIETIIEWMKALPSDQRREREQVLRELTPSFRASPEQLTQYGIMSWDEMRSLNPELITVGSHTLSHPILSTLQPGELRLEISQSRRLLEEKLGRQVEFFSYPNGAFNPLVVEETRRAYTAAVTTEPGFVTPATDRHRLPRIGSAGTLPLLAWRMHRPTA